MALAVKNQEASPAGLADRLHVGILLGTLYVLGALGLIFKGLPTVWWGEGFLNLARTPVTFTLMVLVGAALLAGLVYLASRLVGPTPQPGLRAGVFLGLVSVLGVLLVTRLVGMVFENLVYDHRLFPESVGAVLTAAVGVGLLAYLLRWLFFSPGYEKRLLAVEDMGWFSAQSYKKTQGVRIRRWTMLGILALVGSGIFSLLSHSTLDKLGSQDWGINIPFTGTVRIDSPGDAAKAGLLGDDSVGRSVGLRAFHDLNETLRSNFVRVDKPNDSEFVPGQVVTKTKFNEVRADLAAKNENPPTIREQVDLAKGATSYKKLTLLPDLKFTLPFLLGVLGLWFGWRLVNVPAFADFLIATEAELNKVSWTTRKRLIQDTIVVLATVLLLTVFLFGVDVLWGRILSWKPIGVLKLGTAEKVEETKGANW